LGDCLRIKNEDFSSNLYSILVFNGLFFRKLNKKVDVDDQSYQAVAQDWVDNNY
jgi:hypothetical protein